MRSQKYDHTTIHVSLLTLAKRSTTGDVQVRSILTYKPLYWCALDYLTSSRFVVELLGSQDHIFIACIYGIIINA